MTDAAEAADPSDGSRRAPGKSANAFRTISEVAEELEVPQHVLRFWETKFLQIRPLKRGGGRRYYRPEDVDLLRRISQLLYREGYTIKGVQRLLREGQLRSERRETTEVLLPLELEVTELDPEPQVVPPPRRAAEPLRGLLAEVLSELEEIRDLLGRHRP